jgi:hypothetical protein
LFQTSIYFNGFSLFPQHLVLESQPPLVPLVRQQAYQSNSANLQDYYEELGVSKTADKAEIKSGKEPYSHAGKQ